MKHLTRATLLALTFDIGLAFDRSAAHRHAAARHKHKRESSSVTSSSGQDDSENTNVYSSYPEEQNSSITCVEPTVTVTIDLLSTIVTTTTIMPSFTLSLPSTFATHNASELPAMISQSSSPSRAVIPTSATSSSLQSIQSSWHSLSTFIASSTSSTRTSSLTYGQPASSQASACPTEIQNKTDMLPYFGFNVVNQKPYQLGTPSTGFKTAQDWVSAFENLKTTFPAMNAVRMYSTWDPDLSKPEGCPHLENALQALDTSGINFKILVGIWSDDYNTTGRFDKELAVLDKAIATHGCDKIFAVSVGNEDLERVKHSGEAVQIEMVNKLVDEFGRVRTVLRDHGCCVPVTHTDTYNEIRITANPWVAKLLSNVDQAVIANIFPYWENISQADSWDHLKATSNAVAVAADAFGKEVWLGETGWPFYDAGEHNIYRTDPQRAVNYFQKFGCQILSGQGTGFYYVDWDEDNTNNTEQPSWGVLDSFGNPKFGNLSCANHKPDMDTPKESVPKWLGGNL